MATWEERHETGKGEMRYYYLRRWMCWAKFREEVQKEVGSGAACVLVHVEGQMPCKKRVGGCVLPFYVRKEGSDVMVLKQIIEREEFKYLDAAVDFQTILDAGANSGISTALFAIQYPRARIIAVEPNESSFEMLLLNMHRFANATAVRGKVWNKEARLVFFRGANRTQGAQVQESSSWGKEDLEPRNVVSTSNGISIPYLLCLFNLHNFDFMKMDTEGFEEEVFRKSTENDLKYLEKVKVALIKCMRAKKQVLGVQFGGPSTPDSWTRRPGSTLCLFGKIRAALGECGHREEGQ